MNKSDGVSLATAAAALLMSSAFSAPAAVADEPEQTVKVSQCSGLTSGLVGISSGHEMLSKSLCERLGGTQAASVALTPGAKIGPAETQEAVQIAYCNDVFTCSGFSACKGNNNANCAGKNSCHGIGFVGISSGDLALSKQLCEKLGGAVLSSL
jgi:hypothetical protein